MNKFLAVKVFTSVVEQLGFTAAGQRLGMSVSSVTKIVARLEEELGTRLLNRTTRNVTLTDYGREYYERCVRILADIEEADSMLRDAMETPKGVLRVLLPNSYGRVTLIPELPRFFERYPEMSLELSFADDLSGLLSTRYDVAVGNGYLEESSLVTRVLMNADQVTVASPAYLAAHGAPETPADLVHHKCLIGREGKHWRFQDGEGHEYTVPVNGQVTVLSGDVLREAAVNGLGLARGTRFLYRKDLDKGTLVPVLSGFECKSVPIRVVFRDSRHLARKVRVFIDFLVEISRPQSADGDGHFAPDEAERSSPEN